MKKIYLMNALSGIFFLALSGIAQATVATVVFLPDDPGAVEYVDSISTWDTTGQEMTGMQVTVTGSGDSWSGDDIAYWSSDGSGVYGDDWSLTLSTSNNSTYTASNWIFEAFGSTLIDSIILDGFEYNVVFDNMFYDDALADNGEGTPGSKSGYALTVDTDESSSAGYIKLPDTTYVGDIAVTYIDGVGIAGHDFYGDLFKSMKIEFIDGAFDVNDAFTFFQDTDNVTNPIPEPATMLLFGVGLTGLAVVQARRRKAK